MTTLNERAARARGENRLDTYGTKAWDDLDPNVAARRDSDGWPDYEHDARLWSRLLEEMMKAGGISIETYRDGSLYFDLDDIGAGKRGYDSKHSFGTAVCEAWLAWNEDRKADEP